jgi:uncharacterized protein
MNSSLELLPEDLLRLNDLLLKYDAEIENVQMLQGFFAALICTPTLVMPSEYTQVIWGGEYPTYDTIEEALLYTRVTSELWNQTVIQLAEKPFLKLIMCEDEDGNLIIDDWIDGFMTGAFLVPEDWDILYQDDDNCDLLIPILSLYYENHPDPKVSIPAIDYETYEELMSIIEVLVPEIYRFFLPYRENALHNMKNRAANIIVKNKTGRNDPCPCGSAKKYKKCCMDDSVLFH